MFSKCELSNKIKSSGQYSPLRSTTLLTSTGESGNYDANAVTAVAPSGWLFVVFFAMASVLILYQMRRVINKTLLWYFLSWTTVIQAIVSGYSWSSLKYATVTWVPFLLHLPYMFLLKSLYSDTDLLNLWTKQSNLAERN